MDNTLDIFQINLHKAFAPTSELNSLVKSKVSFIALVQEPAVRTGRVVGISRKMGNIIQSGGNGRPRAAIYCSKNLIMHPLYNLSTLDQAVAMLTVKVDGNDKNIIVCSSYFPYEDVDGPPNSEYAAVVEYCKANNVPLLSGIDANAHHFA